MDTTILDAHILDAYPRRTLTETDGEFIMWHVARHLREMEKSEETASAFETVAEILRVMRSKGWAAT